MQLLSSGWVSCAILVRAESRVTPLRCGGTEGQLLRATRKRSSAVMRSSRNGECTRRAKEEGVEERAEERSKLQIRNRETIQHPASESLPEPQGGGGIGGGKNVEF